LILQNLHCHSTFDDGQNSLEEMARAAASAGLHSLGFSVHTPMPFDACWTISKNRISDYRQETNRLKAAYRGEIALFCGAEWDLHSSIKPYDFDYVIGSIHHIARQGELSNVDNTPEETRRIIRSFFQSDADAMAEAYFRQYFELAEVEEVDIVGHFDLLTKFDEPLPFFSEASPRYLAAAWEAMDALIEAGKIFEINTGAISRGYRTTPYPSQTLLKEICARGGKITISSDAHRAEDIAFGFDLAEKLATSCGFTELWQFDGREFLPVPLGG
jgi:histidinol-phosphatase (PHP family)